MITGIRVWTTLMLFIESKTFSESRDATVEDPENLEDVSRD